MDKRKLAITMLKKITKLILLLSLSFANAEQYDFTQINNVKVFLNQEKIASTSIMYNEKTDQIKIEPKSQILILGNIKENSNDRDLVKEVIVKPINISKENKVSNDQLAITFSKDKKELFVDILSTSKKTPPKNQSKEDLKKTIESSFVPAGFENISEDYQGPTKIMLGNKTIATVELVYNDTKKIVTMQLEPKQIILTKTLPVLNDNGKVALTTFLQKPIDVATTEKGRYYNKNISATFSKNKLILYISIPNNFFKDGQQYKYFKNHPDTKYTIPTITSRINVDYDNLGDKVYSVQANGKISSSKINLTYDLTNNINDNVNDLYLEYFGTKYIYKLGYQEPLAQGVLAPSGNIWGLTVSESTKVINKDFYSAYSAPFIVELTTPAIVKILYRGRTLFRGNLSPGINTIDTKDFPPGNYPVTIEKRNLADGSETQQSKMYFGAQGKYNWIYSGLELTIGEESQYFNSAKDSHVPYFRIKNGYNAYNQEFDLSYTYGEHRNYFGIEHNGMLESEIAYDIATVIDDHGALYWATSANYSTETSNYQLNFNNGYESNLFGSGRQKNASFSYTYKQDLWNAGINATYQNNDSYSSYLSFGKRIIGAPLPASSNISIGYNNNDGFKVVTSLQINFTTDNNYSSASIQKGNSSSQNRITLQNNWSKDNINTASRLQSQLNGEDVDLYNSANIKTPYANFNASTSLSTKYKNDFSLGFDTSLVVSPRAATITSVNVNNGYLVALPIIANDKEYKFIVEKNKVTQGQTLFVDKPQFEISNLHLAFSDPKYIIKNIDTQRFFYPGNIRTISPEVKEVCFVNFTPKIDKDIIYTIVDREKDFFGHSNDETTTTMSTGDKLILKYLHNNKICNTGIVINCNSQYINLGEVRCIN